MEPVVDIRRRSHLPSLFVNDSPSGAGSMRGTEMNWLATVVCSTLFFFTAFPAFAAEWSGKIGAEGRFFPDSPLYAEQAENFGSIVLEPELYLEMTDNISFTFSPFARIDSYDEDRTHYDIRDLFIQMYGDNWEVRAGFDKVFWGAVETAHLADIVNQTDAVESFTGEQKLGQPMLKLSLVGDMALLDLYAMPLFRERAFPGRKSRLRAPILVDERFVTYESSDKDKHIDYAGRLKLTLGEWDIAVSHFAGTSREPSLLPVITPSGLRLAPHYEQINQSGIEATWITGDWLWKAEAIHRQGLAAGDYSSVAGGFEHSFYAVWGTVADIGIVAEAVWDERGSKATTPFNNDIFGGIRLAMNDVSSTELLLFYSHDYVNGSASVSAEGSRRLTDNWKVTLEAVWMLYAPNSDLSYPMRRDSMIQLEIAYYW